jgi:hypothetical protein
VEKKAEKARANADEILSDYTVYNPKKQDCASSLISFDGLFSWKLKDLLGLPCGICKNVLMRGAILMPGYFYFGLDIH